MLQAGPVHFKRRKTRFSNVWAGQYVTYALAKDSGDVYAWGLNNYNQLGKYLQFIFASVRSKSMLSLERLYLDAVAFYGCLVKENIYIFMEVSGKITPQ